ncbi:MAG: TetR/AcrR family transcriptional regulator [Pikeienuella sp.]|uniref:TetR/AcrR family transcriptional regulator n=1 Tax=Pikeienuella sp. TaxID=2831957 RepID=UPI00391D2177
MVGVIRFDRDAALDAAMRLFWAKGFDATSIQMLEEATGLGRGSLYNAFGDKEALFLAALRRYAERAAAPVSATLEGASLEEGLRRLFAGMIARMDEPGRPKGCLLVNSCAAASGSPEGARFAAAALRGMEEGFASVFAAAQAAGGLPGDADIRALARFFSAVAQSLGLLHRAGAERRALEDVARTALSALPLRALSAGLPQS